MLFSKAPAKINLSLHVLGRRQDGYHDLESLVAFAGTGDLLSLDPGPDLSLTTTGPTASDAGNGSDNLVLRAARALAERVPGLATGRFRLIKRLPVAAGIGGGSSDAAAALRLLARANGLDVGDARLFEAARMVGADVPVCLDPRARMMRGAGEQLGPPLGLSPLPVVLVNPGVGLETRRVFAAMGLQPGQHRGLPAHPGCPTRLDNQELRAMLRQTRNDMEDAACVLSPIIPQVLAVLAAAKGCAVARMSGSGATCFAVFEDCRAASRAARAIRRNNAAWWVKTTVLR